MDRKITVREADCLTRDLVCENLRREINDLHEMFTATEEWLLFLTAVPSNSASRNRFPMTPSDVSRKKTRLKIDTIVESENEDETMPLQESQPVEPIRRGSRAASKLASLKMKEPSLSVKLRRPGNTIPEEDASNGGVTVTAPSKRARKDKSNMPKANTSSVTNESSFASAKDSFTSDICSNIKIEPMDTDDDVVLKKVESTETTTYNNCTKKSSLRVKSVTVMRSSKRVTKQLIKTVVEGPARRTKTKNSTEQNIDSSAFDSDDDIPISNLVPKITKPEKTELTTNDGNGKKDASLISVVDQEPILRHHGKTTSQCSTNLVDSTDTQGRAASFSRKAETTETNVPETDCVEEVANLQLIYLGKSKTLAEIHRCKAAPAEDSSNMTPIVQEHAEKTVKSLIPKVLSNATNRNIPEAKKNLVDRDLMAVSVEKIIKKINQEPFVEQVVPAKPDVPVRMTRTKVREMMASFSVGTALPEKKTARKIETSQLLKIARKSLMKANKISLAKERNKNKAELLKSVAQENTSPPPNGAMSSVSQNICSTNNKNRTTPSGFVHPSRLEAQMLISKQPLFNLNSNITTFLPKTKVVSASEKAAEKRKEDRRKRLENNDDALLKKKALIEDRTEQQRKKREEKERNVLAQRALKERELAEMKLRIEKENEEKARLVQEREENLKKEILRKKEEAKQKAAKIEERRVRQEAERLQALKLQEEEQQKLLAQKKKEQEDAERLYAKRMLEEKERKEKEAALKEAAMKLEKQNQVKKLVPTKPLDATFNVDKPVLVAASKYDFPLLDLSKGNDSDYSDAEEDDIPGWAKREALAQTLKVTSAIPIKAFLCYFGSKPTTPDLDEIFPNSRNKHVRSSSAFWKTPPRCSMVPHI